MAKATKAPAKKSAGKSKTISPTFTAIKTAMENMEEDVSKFDGGTQAAGTRVRKGAQEIRKLCQQLRKEVTDIKHTRKG